MLRRLLLLCALAAFGSEVAYGLGMGELELDSALNQEFDAEIELTNVRGLEPQEILPGLASQDDFDRVGIERGYQLLDLRFSEWLLSILCTNRRDEPASKKEHRIDVVVVQPILVRKQ